MLLDALAAFARKYFDGEGKITVAELETHIERAVPKRTKDQQHPKMQNVMGAIKFLAEAR
jgi:hypothetical protein